MLFSAVYWTTYIYFNYNHAQRNVRHICCETINHRQYRTLTSETDCFLLEVGIAVAVISGQNGSPVNFCCHLLSPN